MVRSQNYDQVLWLRERMQDRSTANLGHPRVDADQLKLLRQFYDLTNVDLTGGKG